MSPWWGKPSSKEAKKTNRESFFDMIQRKLKNVSEVKSINKLRGSRKNRSGAISKKGSRSFGPKTRSPSPSPNVSRCLSFAENHYSRPLTVPGSPLPTVTTTRANSGTNLTSKLEKSAGDHTSRPSLYLPLPEPGYLTIRGEITDVEGDIVTASVSSDSSIDSGDSSDSHLVSPLASDCENKNRATINNSLSMVHKDQSCITVQRNSRASSKPAHQLCKNKLLSSPKGVPLHLQIGRPGGFCSAPDSSMSSPSRSPKQAFGQEQVLNSGLWTGKPSPDIASGHCSSPGSGHNSSNNSVVGDPSAFRAHNKCSTDCSPIPSPRMTSPGPSSRIQSNAVSPLHPKAGGAAAELPTRRPDVIIQQTHRLPLPPIKVTKSCPFSPTYSVPSTPSAPRSPARAESSTSPSSRWTKGHLIGRGTFGHVYAGFSRERGEMCAMKEVTLFSDDPKSKECAQQLGQEIALLSQLRHPNIVQYYGSETLDDKLYIYLEYVSGGSIYKLLQEYGQFGEIAIRNYTRQILSGLAYLHAKNTVHRDIKGANILVDPTGQIKLADFGMAKHITGQSLPFSFKGSPYWMAPEVLKNPSGCNLAVDIWSLGCTVLEMATAKPPWSQYEGVAALFKIGNSRELPTIPDHLSEEGKDFVLLCLQRDPIDRPSACQLLEHPFVRSAVLERLILTADPSETPSAIINAVRCLDIGAAKHNVCLDSEAAGIPPTISFRAGYGSSNAHKPRIVSCPVSPDGGLRLPSISMNPSGRDITPISGPHTASGPSTPTPVICSGRTTPYHRIKQPIFPHEAMGMIQKSPNGFQSNGSTSYLGPNHGEFQGNTQARHACRQDKISSESNVQGTKHDQFQRNTQARHASRQDIISSESNRQSPKHDQFQQINTQARHASRQGVISSESNRQSPKRDQFQQINTQARHASRQGIISSESNRQSPKHDQFQQINTQARHASRQDIISSESNRQSPKHDQFQQINTQARHASRQGIISSESNRQSPKRDQFQQINTQARHASHQGIISSESNRQSPKHDQFQQINTQARHASRQDIMSSEINRQSPKHDQFQQINTQARHASRQGIISSESNRQGSKHDQFRINTQARHASRQDTISSENNNAVANHNRRAIEGVPREFCKRMSGLGGGVSQQQRMRDNMRPNASVDHKSSAPMIGRMKGL